MAPAIRSSRRCPLGGAPALALGLFACQDQSPTLAAWPADIDIAVAVRGSGTQLEVLGVVAFEGGQLRTESLSFPAPESSQTRVQVLGWSKSELLARLPELDPDRWFAVEAVSDGRACTTGSVISEEVRRYPLLALEPRVFAFQESTNTFEPDAAPLRSVTDVALDIPLRPNLCGARSPSRWERLDEETLPPFVVIDGVAQGQRDSSDFVFKRVERIDANRIVVLSASRLLLLERGRVFSDTSAEILQSALLPPPPDELLLTGRWWLTDLSIDPRSREREIRTLLVSALYFTGAGSNRVDRGGGVFEVDVSSSGFVPPIRTSTVFWDGIGFPESVSADGDGGWVAVGSTGLVLRKDGEATPVRRGRVDSMSWFRRVISTLHPLARHLAGSEEGVVAFGDLRGPLNLVTLEQPGDVATSIRGLVAIPEQPPRVVISTFSSGALELERDATWSRFGFQTIGPLGCTSTENACGFRTLGAGPMASEHPGIVYATSDRCGDLTVVDLELRCARALPLGLGEMSDLEASHGLLTGVGELGTVLEVFLEE